MAKVWLALTACNGGAVCCTEVGTEAVEAAADASKAEMADE